MLPIAYGTVQGRDRRSVRARLDALRPYLALGADLEAFWLDPEHRKGPTWLAHQDINEVMLATSLVPQGCLMVMPRA